LFPNAPPPTVLHTLSLHDALPIYQRVDDDLGDRGRGRVLLGDEAVDQRELALRDAVGGLHPESAERLPSDFDRGDVLEPVGPGPDRKSTRLNSSHDQISYAVFCLK